VVESEPRMSQNAVDARFPLFVYLPENRRRSANSRLHWAVRLRKTIEHPPLAATSDMHWTISAQPLGCIMVYRHGAYVADTHLRSLPQPGIGDRILGQEIRLGALRRNVKEKNREMLMVSPFIFLDPKRRKV
jgi:hypothetical protein